MLTNIETKKNTLYSAVGSIIFEEVWDYLEKVKICTLEKSLHIYTE